MQIIPVIDIYGGKVVHASGEDRRSYPPLQSVLTRHHQPINVVTDLLAFYPFNIIYVADLEGIFHQQMNRILYEQLAVDFPEVIFWIDAGIQSQQQWTTLNRVLNIQAVIGSESLQDLSVLTSAKHGLLSLDFQNGAFLGQPEIWQQPELWPNKVIAMNLDNVGAQEGPDFTLLRTIQKKRVDVEVIAAGGVRSLQDLQKLAQQNIFGALIASALHNGNLSAEQLRQFQP